MANTDAHSGKAQVEPAEVITPRATTAAKAHLDEPHGAANAQQKKILAGVKPAILYTTVTEGYRHRLPSQGKVAPMRSRLFIRLQPRQVSVATLKYIGSHWGKATCST